MLRTTRFLFAIALICCALAARATHIVGGEMTYRCLGNDQYEIKLSIYRDCYNGIPWFDNPAIISVFDNQWNRLSTFSLFLNQSLNDTLDVYLNNPCLTVPPDVCVHRTTYTRVLSLPFRPGGYYIAHQRCCRNILIRNIPDPLNTGMTIVTHITEDALTLCNSSPVFKLWPPLAICVNEPIDFDHGATDTDGDSIVYRLCTPLNGVDSFAPAPNPILPGPYPELDWLTPPYSLADLLGGDPMKIDAMTGFITGVPNMVGNFVVGVCADEYRNGVLLSSTRRDFQYNVAACGKPNAAIFAPEYLCDTRTVQFQNQSQSSLSYLWYFDWGNDLSKTANTTSPQYTYPADTGTYVVALIVQPGTPCSDTAFHVIRMQDTYAKADLELSYPECDDATLTIQAIDLSDDPLYGISDWQWLLTHPNGQANISFEQQPEFKVQKSGFYTLRLIVTSGNGCKDTTQLGFLAPIPNVDQLASNVLTCPNTPVELFPAANPNYDYAWSPALFLNATNVPNPICIPAQDVVYNVTVSGAGPCVREGVVSVKVIDDASGIPVTANPEVIWRGESSQLDATFPGGISYDWTPAATLSNPAIPNPVATPETTTTYKVKVQVAGSCELEGEVTVTVRSRVCDEPNVFFPTAFSPNADGENDVLRLEGILLDRAYWVIYNRWGEKIFETDDIKGAWDGTWRGEPQPAETYGYYLRVVCIGGELLEKKGNVTLIR